jgi:hypothetical protein
MESKEEIINTDKLLNQKRKNKNKKKSDSSKLNQDNKKTKIENETKNDIKNNKKPKRAFRIIEPYRSLGMYTDNNKIHYFKRGMDRFMLTSNNYSFIVYNLEKLRIERISPPLEKKNNCIISI